MKSSYLCKPNKQRQCWSIKAHIWRRQWKKPHLPWLVFWRWYKQRATVSCLRQEQHFIHKRTKWSLSSYESQWHKSKFLNFNLYNATTQTSKYKKATVCYQWKNCLQFWWPEFQSAMNNWISRKAFEKDLIREKCWKEKSFRLSWDFLDTDQRKYNHILINKIT